MFREKTKKVLVTFPTTTQAMKMERYGKAAGIPGRLIPVPVQISAGCGMAWCSPEEERERLENCIREAEIETERMVHLML
ncbi:MAG: DUF3343 domain-containing protein [Candidatus Limivivens sp.]|nr:DUF3343 domain-containing protein [Candidatus Limivivens sp.]